MLHPTIVAATSAEIQRDLRARASHERLVRAALASNRGPRRWRWGRHAVAAAPAAPVAVPVTVPATTVVSATVTAASESPRAAA